MTARDFYSQATTLLMGDTIQMIVKKATTRVADGPKRKYINVLVNYANRLDADVSHLLQCLLHRLKKNHKMIAYKALVVLNYILVSCKRNDFYRLLSTLPSIINGANFLDSTPEGMEMSRRFNNYIEYMNEKVKYFRDLGYNLDSGPRKDLEEMIENSPENIISEVDHTLSLKNVLDKQDLVFNPLVSKPVLLGNIVLVKDLVRIHANLKKRVIQIDNHREVFPEEVLKNLYDYYQKIEAMEKQINSFSDIAQEMNIQSIVRLIENAKNKIAYGPVTKTSEVSEGDGQKNYKMPVTQPGSDWNTDNRVSSAMQNNNQQNLIQNSNALSFEQDSRQNNQQFESNSKGSLIDFDLDAFAPQSGKTSNSQSDVLDLGALFQNPQQGYQMMQPPSFQFSQPPPYQQFNSQPIQQQPINQNIGFAQQPVQQQPLNQNIGFAQQPVNTKQNQDPFNLDNLINANLNFNQGNANIFAQQSTAPNITPSKGITGVYTDPNNPMYQNRGGMIYGGFNSVPNVQYQQNPQVPQVRQQQQQGSNNPFF